MFQYKKCVQKFSFAIAFALVTTITSSSFAAFRCEDLEDPLVFDFIYTHFLSRKYSAENLPPESLRNTPLMSDASFERIRKAFLAGSSNNSRDSLNALFGKTDLFFRKTDLTQWKTFEFDFSNAKDFPIEFGIVENYPQIRKKDPSKIWPLLLALITDPKKPKKPFINFESGASRTIDILEKSQLSHLGLGGLQAGSRILPTDASVLLLGEGLTGDIYPTMKKLGVRDVRSTDRIYSEEVLSELAQIPEMAAAVENLRRMQAQNPHDFVAGDATRMQGLEATGSRDMILGHNLFAGMDRKSVQKVLNEAVRVLRVGGFARFSTPDEDSQVFARLWMARNQEKLEKSGYAISHVPAGGNSASSYLEILAPRRPTLSGGDGKQPPAATAAAMLLEVAPATEALLKLEIKKAVKSGLETPTFMKKNKLEGQNLVDIFKRFLEIYFPAVTVGTREYSVAVDLFMTLLVQPYNLGQLNQVEANLSRLYDNRVVKTVYVGVGSQRNTVFMTSPFTANQLSDLGYKLPGLYGSGLLGKTSVNSFERGSNRDAFLNLDIIKWARGEE